MGEMITLTGSDGVTIAAYKATPAGPPKGGVVVIQEIFGINPHIRSVADRFAAAGYLAIAPAMFDRVEPGAELAYDEAGYKRGFALLGQIDQAKAMLDVEAAVKAAAEGGKVAVVGFCWGGALAYAAATSFDTLGAAVGYYGGGIAKNLKPRVHCPVELHFGEKDDHIPMSDIEKIRHAHPGVAIYTYATAGHAFNRDVDPNVFDKASADLAWDRTMAFLGRHLG